MDMVIMHVMSSKKCVDHCELGLGTFHLLIFFFCFVVILLKFGALLGGSLGLNAFLVMVQKLKNISCVAK
jgi:hypothetical protein